MHVWTVRSPRRICRDLSALLLISLSTPAWAIPSPELVVSSLSSLSQLWGMAGVMIGGGAVLSGVSRVGRADDVRVRRWLLIASSIAALATALNVAQFMQARAARTERLEATLIRPTPKLANGQTLDRLLREMPYAAQVKSPAGVSTSEVARLLPEIASGNRPDIVALDIRESAEAEKGGLPGTRPVRFPDIADSGIDFTGKTALLFCHNGNRSAETCAALAAKGVNCRFMVGGFEKWLVEGHALSGEAARSLTDLRAIAANPNQSVLLDTSDVRALLEKDKAIFVDVRYPGEFERNHLPGAFNLPIRPTPSADLAARIDALPTLPVITPCYDRRSCFFADILGLELSRRGRDFRGRYTVPWEHFVPSTPPPHVEQWLKSANRSLYAQAVDTLHDRLVQAARSIGALGAVLALAVLSRLIIWPFAAKADRDAQAARVIAPQVAALKQRLADDPQRLARALRHLMARYDMTPVRNLVALLFIPLLAVSLDAVTRLALEARAPWTFGPEGSGTLAFAAAGQPDQTYLVPLSFAIFLCTYLHAALVRRRWHGAVVWGAAAPGLVALAAMMPSGAALYMAVSAGLLLLQRGIACWRAPNVSAVRRRLQVARSRLRFGTSGIVDLYDPVGLGSAGNKALRLSVLAASGVRVPRGVVLTEDFLRTYQGTDARSRQRQLARIWRSIGARRVAVRSSGGREDGSTQSFAGVFETVLDVERAGLDAAIDRVSASFRSGKASAYARDGGSANILIQPMVAAKTAGVMFSQDPAVPGCTLIEWVAGTADGLVSGQTAPQTVRVGRLSGDVIAEGTVPFDAAGLASLARRIEARFGRPQDIEWAHDGRQVFILQSRDIVPPPATAAQRLTVEWQRLAALAAPPATSRPRQQGYDGPVLAMDPMTELLPRPTPASLSLLEQIWSSGGSMDLAARSLGASMPNFDGDAPHARPLYVTAFGALYADQHEATSRALHIPAGAARGLRRSAQALEREMRCEVLPVIAAQHTQAMVLDLQRLPDPALRALFKACRLQLVARSHVAVDRVNIAAQFYLEDARREFARHSLDMMRVLPRPKMNLLQAGLRRLPTTPGPDRTQALQALFGHRAALDYELSCPRFGEDPGSLEIASAPFQPPAPHADTRAERPKLARSARAAGERALGFMTLKENAKHVVLTEVAQLRRILLAFDDRFEMHGGVFFLTLDEIGNLARGTRDALCARAAERQADWHSFASAPPLPTRLCLRDIERGPLGTHHRVRPGSGHLAGTNVSGTGPVEGRAVLVDPRLCVSGAPIPGFEPGDIIVARSLHPSWLPQVLVSGGVVVEVGGWLSHMAILARERGLPMIVGVAGIDAIPTGARIRLELDGQIGRM